MTTLFLLLTTTTILSSAAYETTATATAATTTTTTFIRSRCNSTTYPSLCFSALSPYALSVQNSPLQLALLATNVTLSSIKAAADKSAALYAQSAAADPASRATKALRDCKEVLRDAASNTRYSASQLKALGSTTDASAAQRLWALSNAQTYMSAALTKEDTCIDGLKEMGVAAGSVRGKVTKAEKYTSNALGLVNGLRPFI